jgi:hypothetical protein
MAVADNLSPNTVKRLTQAERDNLSKTTLFDGSLIFNTDQDQLEVYDQATDAWLEIGDLSEGGTISGDLSVDQGFDGAYQVARKVPWTGSSTDTVLLLGRRDVGNQQLLATFLGEKSKSSKYDAARFLIQLQMKINNDTSDIKTSMVVHGNSGQLTPQLVNREYDGSIWVAVEFNTGSNHDAQPDEAHLVGFENVSDGVQAIPLADTTSSFSYLPDDEVDFQVGQVKIQNNLLTEFVRDFAVQNVSTDFSSNPQTTSGTIDIPSHWNSYSVKLSSSFQLSNSTSNVETITTRLQFSGNERFSNTGRDQQVDSGRVETQSVSTYFPNFTNTGTV